MALQLQFMIKILIGNIFDFVFRLNEIEMLPRIIITLLVAGASAAPADPLLVRSSSKTEYILLQPAAKSEQQYVQLYTVQPK